MTRARAAIITAAIVAAVVAAACGWHGPLDVLERWANGRPGQ